MLEAKIQQIRRAETMNFIEEKFRHKRAFPLMGYEKECNEMWMRKDLERRTS